MLSRSVWANVAQGNYLCNVDPWLTGNFYEKNDLYNVVSPILRHHYIEKLPSKYFRWKTENTFDDLF